MMTSCTVPSCTRFKKLLDLELIRSNPAERRNRAVQHMIRRVEFIRALQCKDVARVLDNADDRFISIFAAADRAKLPVRQVAATAQ